MSKLPRAPYEPDREIGSVVDVTPGHLTVNLPLAGLPPQRRFGHRVPAGEVGEHVLIDAGDVALLGRITSVRLPERERASVGAQGGEATVHPTGMVRPLSTIDLATATQVVGVSRYPRIGDRVYSAHPAFLSWMVSVEAPATEARAALTIGQLTSDPDVIVRVGADGLFGRHCAILGSTGAGKSWTTARLVEESRRIGLRILLLDATGEYHKLSGPDVLHVSLGSAPDRPEGTRRVVLPYHCLHEMDLFALLKPAPGAQAPRLREAIRSLRLATVLGAGHELVTNGCIVKTDRPRGPIETAMRDNAHVLSDPMGPFEFEQLAEQVKLECIWPTARGPIPSFGGVNQQDLGYCSSLIMRIEGALAAPELGAVFDPSGNHQLFTIVDGFLNSDRYTTLRVSLANVPFTQDAREVVVNAIGRDLLKRARENAFDGRPLLVVLDEAHNFLEHTLWHEQDPFPLDAFELIAKEGRKYELVLCVATQRARDLPEGVVSQIGTFLVHRISNDRDRELLERSGSDLEHDALGALPLLTPGEVIGVGVGFPIPLRIRVAPPTAQPDSAGPGFASRTVATAAPQAATTAEDMPTSAVGPARRDELSSTGSGGE